jgi:hypothetical protein
MLTIRVWDLAEESAQRTPLGWSLQELAARNRWHTQQTHSTVSLMRSKMLAFGSTLTALTSTSPRRQSSPRLSTMEQQLRTAYRPRARVGGGVEVDVNFTATRFSSISRVRDFTMPGWRLNAHDVHDAGETVGEYVQRHLGGDLGQTLHWEVRRPHPHL